MTEGKIVNFDKSNKYVKVKWGGRFIFKNCNFIEKIIYLLSHFQTFLKERESPEFITFVVIIENIFTVLSNLFLLLNTYNLF